MGSPARYEYEFDTTTSPHARDLRLSRRKYAVLLRGYRLLRDELQTWNERVAQETDSPPYEREVKGLDNVIDWSQERIRSGLWEIVVRGISVGSLRYAKAALLLDIYHRKLDREGKAKQEWPSAALHSLDNDIRLSQSIADSIDQEPSDVLWELIPRNEAIADGDRAATERAHTTTSHFDLFICHANEDKNAIARPLASALRQVCPSGSTSLS